MVVVVVVDAQRMVVVIVSGLQVLFAQKMRMTPAADVGQARAKRFERDRRTRGKSLSAKKRRILLEFLPLYIILLI